MAGRPKTRARREAERKAAGQVPAMRRGWIPVEQWNAMSQLDRFESNCGMSDRDVHLLLSIPWEEADLHERALKVRVWEVSMKYRWRIGMEQTRNRDREEALRLLAKALIEKGDDDAEQLKRFVGSDDAPPE